MKKSVLLSFISFIFFSYQSSAMDIEFAMELNEPQTLKRTKGRGHKNKPSKRRKLSPLPQNQGMKEEIPQDQGMKAEIPQDQVMKEEILPLKPQTFIIPSHYNFQREIQLHALNSDSKGMGNNWLSPGTQFARIQHFESLRFPLSAGQLTVNIPI